jgi:hypothetical protein
MLLGAVPILILGLPGVKAWLQGDVSTRIRAGCG